MPHPKKPEQPVLPKGVTILSDERLTDLLNSYGDIYEDSENYYSPDEHLIGELVRELAWRRGATSVPQKKTP